MRFARTVEEILLEQREAQLLTPGKRLPHGFESTRGGNTQGAAAREDGARLQAARAQRITELRAQGATLLEICAATGLTARQVVYAERKAT